MPKNKGGARYDVHEGSDRNSRRLARSVAKTLARLRAQHGAKLSRVRLAKPARPGWLGNRVRMKHLLFWIYLIRAIAVLLFLIAPKTALTFYVFAAVLGVSWLATVPPSESVSTTRSEPITNAFFI